MTNRDTTRGQSRSRRGGRCPSRRDGRCSCRRCHTCSGCCSRHSGRRRAAASCHGREVPIRSRTESAVVIIGGIYEGPGVDAHVIRNRVRKVCGVDCDCRTTHSYGHCCCIKSLDDSYTCTWCVIANLDVFASYGGHGFAELKHKVRSHGNARRVVSRSRWGHCRRRGIASDRCRCSRRRTWTGVAGCIGGTVHRKLGSNSTFAATGHRHSSGRT